MFVYLFFFVILVFSLEEYDVIEKKKAQVSAAHSRNFWISPKDVTSVELIYIFFQTI